MIAKTFEESSAAQVENERLAKAKREEISARPGGVEGFRDNVIVEPLVTDAQHQAMVNGKLKGIWGLFQYCAGWVTKKSFVGIIKKRLNDYYKVYEKCFPIEEERESHRGIFDLLTKGNYDDDMKQGIGAFRPYREFVVTLRDPVTNEVIGGLNFVVYSHGPNEMPTVHSTYAFLAPEYRNLGLARKLFDIRDKMAMEYLHSVAPEALARHGGFLTFSEQNIPEKMEGAAYVRDSSSAVDQVDRLKIWTKLGYSAIDPQHFTYIQPPLEDQGEPCNVLSLNAYFREVRQVNGKSEIGQVTRVKEVPIKALFNHLKAFFLQSVRKDPKADIYDKTTRSVLDALSRKLENGEQTIPTIPMDERAEYLKVWADRVAALAEIMPQAKLDETTIEQLYLQNKAAVDQKIAANARLSMTDQNHPSAQAAALA